MEEQREEQVEAHFRELREAMVREQIERRGIRDPRLLDVMRRLPRHWFVPPQFSEQAYEDAPVPLGNGATISQPYMVAAMTALLHLRGDENVLEIGTGSGYQAAVLAEMAGSVHTIEFQSELSERADHLLRALGFRNVFVHTGDGSLGWPPAAPYQSILVTAAAPEIPGPLVAQLDEGGTLIIPVGGRKWQQLERWRKQGRKIRRENIFAVAFVPLRGQFGWQDKEQDE